MCWKPAAEHLRPDGQQVGDEVVRVEEGADERKGETEGDRTLDHPPLLKLQVDHRLGFPLVHNPLQVLLGPVHAATVGGEPDHLAGRHLLLQR